MAETGPDVHSWMMVAWETRCLAALKQADVVQGDKWRSSLED